MQTRSSTGPRREKGNLGQRRAEREKNGKRETTKRDYYYTQSIRVDLCLNVWPVKRGTAGQERRFIEQQQRRDGIHLPWKRKKRHKRDRAAASAAQLVKQPHECLTLVNDRARRLIYEQINQNGEEFLVSGARERRALSLVPRPLSCR